MPISSNNSHITFNNNSTQNTAFLGSIAAANITGTITGSQIAPATITAPNIAPGVIPSGGLSGQVFVSTTPGPAAWTAPPTTTRIKVTVVGGGGGSAKTSTNGAAGGGAAIKFIPVVGGTPYPYTVGAGGTAGSPGGSTGGTGGTTSFGSPAQVSATGGAGSPGCSAYSIVGGTGSSGDMNFPGGPAYAGPTGVGVNPCNPSNPPSICRGFGSGGSLLAQGVFGCRAGLPFGGGASGFGSPTGGAAGGPGGIIIEF